MEANTVEERDKECEIYSLARSVNAAGYVFHRDSVPFHALHFTFYIMPSGYSEFIQKVIIVVQAVPQGKVVSYGQVAAYVGSPRAARQVGGVLRNMEGKVSMPWWRVINNEGRISIKGNLHNSKEIQKQLLEADGIVVGPDFTVDIKAYRFKADMHQLQSWGLGEQYRERVLVAYGL